MNNKLKELTKNIHHQAERTRFASRLLRGLGPVDYHRYLVNQYEIYSALESASEEILIEFPHLARSQKILEDLEELEVTYQIGRDPSLVCDVVERYRNHVSILDRSGLLAHFYVRHFGDMYGGQIIKSRNPGEGNMYNFDDVENLKAAVRTQLTDDMVDEATRCFQFAIDLFEELQNE